jgi:hypothetical protein
MQMADLFDKVINNSKYAGNYEFDDLMEYMHSTQQSGLAIAEEGLRNFILIFVSGEPEGATLIDNNGMLFGNKAVYLLKHNEIFKLFLIEPEFGESLAARCKVHDKSHLRSRLSDDLPTFGGRNDTLGKLCILVKNGGKIASGMRVSIRKGRQVLASEIIGADGKICFKLINGSYDCIIEDRAQKMHRYVIDFREGDMQSVIDLEGER